MPWEVYPLKQFYRCLWASGTCHSSNNPLLMTEFQCVWTVRAHLASEAGLASWSLWATASLSHWTIFGSVLATDTFSPEDSSLYTWGNGKSPRCNISRECLAVWEKSKPSSVLKGTGTSKHLAASVSTFWLDSREIMWDWSCPSSQKGRNTSQTFSVSCCSQSVILKLRVSCWTLLCFLWLPPVLLM